MKLLPSLKHHWKEKITCLILGLGFWYLISQNLNTPTRPIYEHLQTKKERGEEIIECPHCHALYFIHSDRQPH